jgi:hypothetical protein
VYVPCGSDTVIQWSWNFTNFSGYTVVHATRAALPLLFYSEEKAQPIKFIVQLTLTEGIFNVPARHVEAA